MFIVAIKEKKNEEEKQERKGKEVFLVLGRWHDTPVPYMNLLCPKLSQNVSLFTCLFI